MAVEDRVAFALIFLSDLRLADYILGLTTKLTEEGDLAGLLLTGTNFGHLFNNEVNPIIPILGTSANGLDILQRYLDVSGDIQSVCILVMRAFSSTLMQQERVQDWLKA